MRAEEFTSELRRCRQDRRNLNVRQSRELHLRMVNLYRWLRGDPLIKFDCFQDERCEPAPALTLRCKCQVLLGTHGNPVTFPEAMKKAPFLGL